MSKEDLMIVYKGVDKNGDGKVSFEEFIEYLYPGEGLSNCEKGRDAKALDENTQKMRQEIAERRAREKEEAAKRLADENRERKKRLAEMKGRDSKGLSAETQALREKAAHDSEESKKMQ